MSTHRRSDAFATFRSIVCRHFWPCFSCTVAKVKLLCSLWWDVLHTHSVAPALFSLVVRSQRGTVVFLVSPRWLHLVTLTVVSPHFHLLSEACCVTRAASIYLLISRTWGDIHIKEKRERLQQSLWNYGTKEQQLGLHSWGVYRGFPKFLILIFFCFTWIHWKILD